MRRGTGVRRILALIALAALAIPGQVAAADLPDGSVSVTGTLQVAIADDFAAGRAQDIYSLATDSGTVGLAITGVDPKGLAGARVAVTGKKLSDGRIAVAADAIQVVTPPARAAAPSLDASQSSAALATAMGVSTSAAVSTRKIAVIVADYSDLPGYPVTTAQAGDAFNTSPASVKSYFEATSRGRVTTAATILGPWHLGTTQCSGGSWSFDDTRVAAFATAAAHSVDLSGYDHVVLWTKTPCGSGWAGVGEVPGNYVQIVVDWATYNWDEPALTTMVASHELEHNLGLSHSNGLACFDGSGAQVALNDTCSGREYYDQLSTMGMAGSSNHALLDAERLYTLGWLDPSESRTLAGMGTYSLVPTYSSQSGVRLLRIARATQVVAGYGAGYWTMEIRSTLAGSSFDQLASTGTAATTGVTIRFSMDGSSTWGTFGPSFLVDNTANGSSSGGINFWDAPLQPGGTFRDPVGGVTIHVDSVTASGATVTIGDPLAAPPDAPTAVTAIAGNASARISWTAPFDGGRAITGYTATSTPGGFTCTTTGTTSCVVAGLSNGTPYTFKVRATNASGTGPASASSAAVTPLAVPGRPTAVSGVPHSGSIDVSWVAPVVTGGSSISRYVATASPGGATCSTTTATSCPVSGLANGTPYTFTVTASNALGTSLPSAPSAPVTPGTVPGKPTSVTALASSGRAVVSWHAPASNGGAPISSYTATAVPGGQHCTISSALSCTVTGLTNRTSYRFTVTATNSAGRGLASDPSPAVMPLAGATYVPVTPNRLVDSRAGTRLGLAASLTAGTPASFGVTGRAAGDSAKNIPSNAIAVTGNITAVNEGSKGYFSLTPTRPSGTPSTSTLNFPAGDIRANAVTAPLGSDGKLWVTFIGAAGKKADVIFDVTGYFVPNTSGATYVPLTPNRLVDSRAGTRLGLAASLTSGTPASFKVTGRNGDASQNVPAGAIAVTGNLTAVGEGSKGYFSLTPTRPSGTPSTSTLNFPKGDVRANSVTVPLGSSGVLWVTFVGTAGAKADVVFDVTGYFVAGTSGATYVPLIPSRLVDSRSSTHLGIPASLTSGTPAGCGVTSASADPTRNVPPDAIAITGNLTAVNEISKGYLSLTPTRPAGVPSTSTVNFPAGDIRANAVTVTLGPDGRLWVTFVGTAGMRADVVLDVTGYFTMG